MDALYLIIPASVLCVILITLFIKESYIKGHVVTFKIVFVTILLFVSLASSFFVDEIEFKYYLYVYAVLYILIGFLMYITVSSSNKEKKIKSEYFSCIELNNYFIYLDKKNRVVDISKSFLSFLNVSLEEAKGFEFTSILLKRFSNIDINGIDYNSSNINDIFLQVKNSTKELPLNITCLNLKGNQVQLNLIDRPVRSNKNKFLSHIIYGISKDNKLIEKTEQDLNEKSIQLEMNRRRFRAFMEVSKEPVYLYNIENNSIWANDEFVKEFGFLTNSISFDEYKNRIYPDDLNFYLSKLEDLTLTNAEYHLKYRLKKNYDYIYVEEYGKKIYGPQTEIISFIKEVKSDIRTPLSYEYTLDTILEKKDLLNILNNIESTYTYFLICMRFNNVESINKQYDRKFGDICMSEYLEAIKKAFVDNNLIFRTDGLEFYFVILDMKKMEKFKSALRSTRLTNSEAHFSGKNVIVETSFGIVNNQINKNVDTLFKNAKNANNIAQRDQNKYYFYE